MIIATPREIKTHEYRVGLTPACVKSYISRGHTVLMEKDAGTHTSFSNEQYEAAGATIVDDRKKFFHDAGMIVKVKEPLKEEFDLFHELLSRQMHRSECGTKPWSRIYVNRNHAITIRIAK